MIETKVAKRYARSLFLLSRERNELETTAQDMKLLSSVCDTNRDFVLLLASPIIHADKKLGILKKVFAGSMSALSISFFEIIIRKRRESFLDGIAKEFVSQYKKHKGIQTAIVTSASGLDDKLRSEVYRVIKESLKSEVELIEKVDKNLIGGFVLRVGDRQYDASISSELRRLRQELIDSSYVRKN